MKGPAEEIDLILCSMVFARVLFPAVDIPGDLERLEELAEECRRRGGDAGRARDRIATISEVLVEKGYAPVPRERQEADDRWSLKHQWLHQLLDTRLGQCNSLSLLYLSLCRSMGLRVALAMAPEHVLIRCTEGDAEFNVEATARGLILEDAFYRDRSRISPGSIYLRPLSGKQAVAMLLSNHLGYQLLKDHRHPEALLCFDHTALLFPELPTVWVNRGIALFELERPLEAEGSFDTALRLDSSFVPALTNKSAALLQLGRPQEALACAQKALSQAPGDVNALMHAALALGRMGRDAEALPLYDQALQKNPRSAKVWSNRGVSLAALGRFEEAVADYTRALKLDPRLSSAWVNLGIAHVACGRQDKALDCYARAIEIDPENSLAWMVRGKLRLGRGEYPAAIRDLDEVLRYIPRASVYLLRAVAYEALKQFDQAEADCSRALDLESSEAGSYVLRADIRWKKEDFAGAAEDFQQAARLEPKEARYHSNRALLLARLGKNQEALQAAETALSIDPEKPYYAFAARGLVALNSGRPADALEDFLRFEAQATADDALRPLVKEWKARAASKP